MKRILFLRGRQAYLPEVAAYIRYLEEEFPDVQGFDFGQLDDCDFNDFDIIWRFMGTDRNGEGRYVVHEYNSLSAPPFPRVKNWIKKIINKRPDRRVFLNTGVQSDFGFSDNVPHALRDMGVAQSFFEQSLNPEHDFVYAGSVHRGAEVLRMIEHLASAPDAGSLLIIGTVSDEILEFYKACKNITFTGAVPYGEVPALMSKARYGLNLIPNRYPFNCQTVTKVLEYCALGLPVVSMRYPWIEGFMKEQSGQAFWLDHDYKNLSVDAVQKSTLSLPDVKHLEWSKVIESSGIFDFLCEDAK